jgi:hypothetical protein
MYPASGTPARLWLRPMILVVRYVWLSTGGSVLHSGKFSPLRMKAIGTPLGADTDGCMGRSFPPDQAVQPVGVDSGEA